ncbi:MULTISPECIES: ABC transporter permease [unclassified Mesorhizobium]|uniref:ABC transporter permease n=1 Tax=unclassified Mesorhizobium TaxID=325217 RepID=UPI001CCC190B|nr:MULTISPECIES: ABC transporter permease [unclassified Mesorhizobium]MBZ9683500.1 ABC transporter permease [Mesorhizobium sp. CO1-1-2]MBZ9698494.1 ABC transporter permease [Mesorhizobium sp. CO1-1-9]
MSILATKAAATPHRLAPSISARAKALLASGTGIIIVLYIILYGLYSVWDPTALTADTVLNLTNNAVPLAIAAAGQTLIVLSRGFDLSVAGVISLTNVIMAAYPLDGPMGAVESLAICLAIGGLVGLINGFLVAVLRVQSIAATLATMIICQGLSLVILDAPGGTVADFISYDLTDVLFGVIPISGLFVAAVVVLWMICRRTAFGTGLYVVGADETAAHLSGINVKRVRILSFVIGGMLYGLAGFMLSAQTATGNPNAGASFLMLTFAAVALGGTSLSGGRGSVIASIIGAATLMLLQKVLFAGGVSSFYTGIFQGVVLVLAVVFGNVVTHFVERRGAT